MNTKIFGYFFNYNLIPYAFKNYFSILGDRAKINTVEDGGGDLAPTSSTFRLMWINTFLPLLPLLSSLEFYFSVVLLGRRITPSLVLQGREVQVKVILR